VTEFYFDTHTGNVILGVGVSALHFTVTGVDSYQEMLASAKTPIHPDNAAATHPAHIPEGVMPLHELILTEDTFPFHSSDFRRSTPHNWDKQLWLRVCGWGLRVLQADDTPRTNPTLLRADIDRFNILGLCAGYRSISKWFSTMAAYRSELGLPEGKLMHVYDQWSTNDFITYAKKISQQLKRRPGHTGRPSSYDYEARAHKTRNKGPGRRVLLERVGGVNALNELIGYPDIKTWSDEDFIEWGIKVQEANPHEPLGTNIFNILSRRDRGPSANTIASRFGIRSFSALVAEQRTAKKKAAAEIENHWAGRYDYLITWHLIEQPEKEIPPAEKARIAMRYDVARLCLPTAPAGTIRSIARSRVGLITDIRARSNKGVTAAQVEMVAVSLHVFDELFPIERDLEGLYVSPEELAAKRRERVRINNRALQRSKA